MNAVARLRALRPGGSLYAPLRGRLGRQMLAIFALCSLLPLALVLMLADRHVAAALQASRHAELALAARSHGQELLHQLQLLDALLLEAGAAGEQTPRVALANGRLAAALGDSIAGAARYDVGGMLLESAGEPPPLAVDDKLLALTADGRAALLPPARAGEPVRLVRRARDAAGPSLVALALRGEALWRDGTASVTPVTRYCVLALGPAAAANPDDRHFLSCPAELAAGVTPAVFARLAAADATDADLLLQADDEAAVALSWPLQFNGRLAGPGWTVLAAQPESYALASVRAFRLIFVPLAALVLLAVLLFGARQVLRFTAPISELLAGTRRLAAQDFTAKVPVARDDEFGQLARAFNDMVIRIETQFGTMKAMAAIDRAILNSVDLGEVARNSIHCVRHIMAADAISIGLVQPDDPAKMVVHTRRRGAGARIERADIGWSEEHAAAAQPGPGRAPRLPESYLRHLDPSRAPAELAAGLVILPVARGSDVRGVVVLFDTTDHGKPQPLPPGGTALLSGLVDRLAVALSTAARDWKLHVQAHYDALTGLPNRHQLLLLLAQRITEARRTRQQGAVLFLDLDRFKEANDSLGHAAGDELLRRAAERIRLALRATDTVARIGGDEFTIVLAPVPGAREAGQVASQIISVLSRAFEIDGQKVYVGASVGIALFPGDGDCADEVLKRADTAMYRAKDQGRGRFAFFKESMALEVTARAALDRELRQALERNEFVLHYQPQLDLASGELVSAEALVRWNNPRRGLLGPGEFIELAEESNLIEGIGAWVLREACAQHRRWEERGLMLPRIAVNVSSHQVRQRDFLATIDRALLAEKRRPRHIEIEITESMFLDGGERALHTLRALELAGIRVAIDDFGTGYSSLSYLRTMPATVLKVDRSFVTDIAQDHDAETIAAAIITMARTLRKEVVIEGVETAEQLAVLARLGGARIQGYYVSRPLPPQKFEDFYVRHHRALAELRSEGTAAPGAGAAGAVAPLAAQAVSRVAAAVAAGTTVAAPAGAAADLWLPDLGVGGDEPALAVAPHC